jgi:hypothetical protein
MRLPIMTTVEARAEIVEARVEGWSFVAPTG